MFTYAPDKLLFIPEVPTPKLYIITGAGISAESGLATFRDQNGLWNQFNIEEICNIRTWKHNRAKVHEFYNSRRLEINKATPNPAHHSLSKWEKEYGATHFTQNIDDLLEKAGCQHVVHLHGKINEMLCTACANVWHVGAISWEEDMRCPKCDSYRGVKPNVVFFGENAPNYPRFWKTVEKQINPEDTLLVMGTSGNVIPINEITEELKCFKILNNFSEEPTINAEYFDKVFYGPASSAVKEIELTLVERMATPKLP